VLLADSNARVLPQHRLTRAQFDCFFDIRNVARIVVEACGSAHRARMFAELSIEVIFLPATYVRVCVRRSKTDTPDAVVLVRAMRCRGIVAVKVKSVEQHNLCGPGIAHVRDSRGLVRP
jgi:transposase